MLRLYLIAATLVTFSTTVLVPHRNRVVSALENVTTSLIIAVALGWLVWPLTVTAWWKTRRA